MIEGIEALISEQSLATPNQLWGYCVHYLFKGKDSSLKFPSDVGSNFNKVDTTTSVGVYPWLLKV